MKPLRDMSVDELDELYRTTQLAIISMGQSQVGSVSRYTQLSSAQLLADVDSEIVRRIQEKR